MRPIIDNVSQLEEHSTYREYKRQVLSLVNDGAPAEVIESYRDMAAQHCFLAFAERMVGPSLKVEPFHEIIASAFEDVANLRYHRLIISCPPRSGKSFLSQLFLAWLFGRDEESQHILASYGKGLSNQLFRGCLSYLRGKPFLRVFPKFQGFEEGTKAVFKSGGNCLVTSVGGESTGYTAGTPREDSPGIGISLTDDPLKGSDSRAALKTLENWWAEKISTRRTNRWGQVLIGTRFAVNDLHGFLMDSDGLHDEEENLLGWRWVNITGLCENEENDPLGRKLGESHWPGNPVFSSELLLSQKKMMGSNRFSALYQGSPVAESSDLFQVRWLQIKDVNPRRDVTWFGIDTAFSEKQNADESVISIYCQTRPFRGEERDDDIYLLEQIHGRYNFPDLLENLRSLVEYYSPSSIAIEQAASGQSLIQVLEREILVPVYSYRPTKSKQVRLQQILPLYEQGRVIWARGAWNKPLRDQLLQFPLHPHDDMVDSMVYGLIHWQEVIQSAESADLITTFNREHIFLNGGPRRPKVEGGGKKRLGRDGVIW